MRGKGVNRSREQFNSSDYRITTVCEMANSKLTDLQRKEIEIMIGTKLDRRPFNAWLNQILRQGLIWATGNYYSNEKIHGLGCQTIIAGGTMEKVDLLLKELNGELTESRKVLQTLTDEVGALSDIIQPKLVEHIKRLRDSRMSSVREVQEIMTALKDIRRFFLESDYAAEIIRLKEFIALCRELKALKDDGTLDAVADSVIKLAIKGVV